LDVPIIRDWLGPGPLITSILIGTAAASLRRFIWRSKTAGAYAATSVSVTRSVVISLIAGGGSAVIALSCGASADTITMLTGLTTVYLADDVISSLLKRRSAADQDPGV
jgi:hypothetical protein